MSEPQTEREMLLLLGKDIGTIATDVKRLADHVSVQNGRVEKLEAKQLEQISYDAGRAALRKSDIAWLGLLLTVATVANAFLQVSFA